MKIQKPNKISIGEHRTANFQILTRFYSILLNFTFYIINNKKFV